MTDERFKEIEKILDEEMIKFELYMKPSEDELEKVSAITQVPADDLEEFSYLTSKKAAGKIDC